MTDNEEKPKYMHISALLEGEGNLRLTGDTLHYIEFNPLSQNMIEIRFNCGFTIYLDMGSELR